MAIYVIAITTIKAQVTDTMQSKSCFDSIPGIIVVIDSIFEENDTSLLHEVEIDGGPYGPVDGSSTTQQSKWKNVFFLHGLGGGETTWWQQRDYVFQTYNTETPKIEYLQSTNIANSANVLYNEFSQYNGNMILKNNEYKQDYKRDESIVITHSMGGVVARQMDKDISDLNLTREFGALATFGGPHQGAVIIKSLDDGNVEQLIQDYCGVFFDVALEELDETIDLEIESFWGFLVNGKLKKLERQIMFYAETEIKDYVCDDFKAFGFDELKRSIAPPVGDDLHPTDGIIQELNTHTVEIQNVAFYGIETGSTESDDDGYMALREIYSLVNNINDETLWGADADEGYIKKYEDLKTYLLSQSEYYKHTPPHSYKYRNYGCLYPIWTCDKDQECIDLKGVPSVLATIPTIGVQFMECVVPDRISERYQNAYNTISHFDKQYRILFGHYEVEYTETGTITESHCLLYDEDNIVIDEIYDACENLGSDILDDPELDHYNTVIVEVPIMEYVGTYFPGDGVVPAYSQKYFPGVKNTSLMLDTNHQQMRNSSKTQDVFNELFDENRYGEKFHLNKK